MRQLELYDRTRSRNLESLLIKKANLRYSNVREIVNTAKSNLGYDKAKRMDSNLEEECMRLCQQRGYLRSYRDMGSLNNEEKEDPNKESSDDGDIVSPSFSHNFSEKRSLQRTHNLSLSDEDNCGDIDGVRQMIRMFGDNTKELKVTDISKRFDKCIELSVPHFPTFGLGQKRTFDDAKFKLPAESECSKEPSPETPKESSAEVDELAVPDISVLLVGAKKKKRASGKRADRKKKKKDTAKVSSDICQPLPLTFSSGAFSIKYRLGEEIGDGAFSVVQEAIDKETGNMYAVKIVQTNDEYLEFLGDSQCSIEDEITMLLELKHPNILTLTDVYLQGSTYYLVTDLMSGGELLDRITSKEFYNEDDARNVTKAILGALSYCHERRIVHRDLKPENLLLRSTDSDCDVMIADFGFAKKVIKADSLTTKCGSPGYVAPEILEQSHGMSEVGEGYDIECDMWSFGVILYILLGGYSPFEDDNLLLMERKILLAEYEYHEQFWGSVSKEAKNLISSFLTIDPKRRLTAREALESNCWINGSQDRLRKLDRTSNLAEMRRFTIKSKLRAAVQTITAANRIRLLGF